MQSIAGASEIYLPYPSGRPGILAPDRDGIAALVDPQPLVLRAAYVGSDLLLDSLSRARRLISSPECDLLFHPIPSVDGPPNRSGRLFSFQGLVSAMPWKNGQTARFGIQARRYAVVTPLGPWTWNQEASCGRPGYFISGQSENSELWRLFRLEADALQHQVLTLAPMQFAPNCPRADFSSIADAGLGSDITSQYDEFCQRVAHNAYRDVATKARNIVEGLVRHKLREHCHPTREDLARDLQTVKGLLEGASRATCGWSDLEYHLAHKIRLVHGQTHPPNVTDLGRSVRPEFALSVIEDLGELLRIWGYVRTP